ncbi:MAG: LEPR-XLL domain-containing protein, partial [Candidatus Saccharimonadales bacterium]
MGAMLQNSQRCFQQPTIFSCHHQGDRTMQTWFRSSPRTPTQKKALRKARRTNAPGRGKFLSAFAFEQLEHRVLLAADLAVTKVSVPPAGPVTQGELVTYNISVTNLPSVTNLTPTNASNVQLTDTLPAGLTFVSATSTQGTVTHSGNTVTGNLGTLAGITGLANVTIQAMVNSTATGTIAGNTAGVTDTSGDAPATSPATGSLTVTALPATGTVDLSITKTAATSPVSAGGTETYTITVKNNDATTTAAGVTVIDTLPAG